MIFIKLGLVALFYLNVLASKQEKTIISFADAPCGKNGTHVSGNIHLSDVHLKKGVCYIAIEPQPSANVTGINLFIQELFLHENDAVTIFKTSDDALIDKSPIIKPLRAQQGSFTLITELKTLYIKIVGNDTAFQRMFTCYYQAQSCTLPIPPTLEIIHSPVLFNSTSKDPVQCKYTYTRDLNFNKMPIFSFDIFNYTKDVKLTGTTKDGSYSSGQIVDFFPVQKEMEIELNIDIKNPGTFRLRMHLINSDCSGYVKTQNEQPVVLKSPPNLLNNGSIITECCWLIENADNRHILGISFSNIEFDSVYDLVAINDGSSQFASPLTQVTKSNINNTKDQIIRTSGQYMWIGFKPTTFASNFSANVTVHEQGGIFKQNGTISMHQTVGNDTVFLLEVEQDQVVLLNFSSYTLSTPHTLKIYDGFTKKNLLTTIHQNPWYPLLSKTNKMMIIVSSFKSGTFTAFFQGIKPGCLHMSTYENDNYILSGNCNSSCAWIIPPQDTSYDVLLLDLQYISLEKEDQVTIKVLNNPQIVLSTFYSNTSHVPQIIVPSSQGFYVEIQRGLCQNQEKVILVGHSSYMPNCSTLLSPNISEAFKINSPNYPDTYPLLSNCEWKITTSKNNLIHLAFANFKLASKHCVKISHDGDKKTLIYEGNQLPDDLILRGGVIVEFDSSNCGKSEITETLSTDQGFLINGNIADCGDVLSDKTGQFDTSKLTNKSLCIWKIVVPPEEKDGSVNIINLNIDHKTQTKNYKLQVYDGASIREPEIKNFTDAQLWSRTNTLLIRYEVIDSTKPISEIGFKYTTKNCNKEMQCANKICMHPDWKCNGIDNCGDDSDERNCASIPVPPETKTSSMSGGIIALIVITNLIIGFVLGIGAPILYNKYKDRQYSRFQDISIIE